MLSFSLAISEWLWPPDSWSCPWPRLPLFVTPLPLSPCPASRSRDRSWGSFTPGISEKDDEMYANRKKGPGWVGERDLERDGLPAQRCRQAETDPQARH